MLILNSMKNEIILIDDDLMSLRSLENVLIEWKYQTFAFEKADKNFFKRDFSATFCCIVDYRLNYIDGISVIKNLKIKYPNMICILISGYMIDEHTLNDNQSIINLFLPKPINVSELNLFLNNINKEEKCFPKSYF